MVREVKAKISRLVSRERRRCIMVGMGWNTLIRYEALRGLGGRGIRRDVLWSWFRLLCIKGSGSGFCSVFDLRTCIAQEFRVFTTGWTQQEGKGCLGTCGISSC